MRTFTRVAIFFRMAAIGSAGANMALGRYEPACWMFVSALMIGFGLYLLQPADGATRRQDGTPAES